jgi:hypothetical protein
MPINFDLSLAKNIGIALIAFISPLSIRFVGNDFTGINIKGDIFTVIEFHPSGENQRQPSPSLTNQTLCVFKYFKRQT